MNKKLLLMLTLVLSMALLLTACGPNTTAYLEKQSEVENWEASEGKISANVEMVITGLVPTEEGEEPKEGETVKFNVPFEMDMYMIGQDKGKIDISYDFTGIKSIAPAESVGEEFPDKLESTIFLDENRVFIEKELFTLGGNDTETPEILKGPEKYIALDISELGLNQESEDKDLEEKAQNFVEGLKKAYEGYKSGFDMKREGDKFSYELTIEQGKTELLSLLKYTKANSDLIFSAFEGIVGIDPETQELNKSLIAQGKEAFENLKEEDLEEFTTEMAKTLKGSKISEVTEFKTDLVDQKLNLVLNLDETVKANMNMDSQIKKSEVKELEIPSDYKAITYSEYMESVIEASLPEDGEKPVAVFYNDESIDFDTEAIIEDGRTLVPFRAFLEKLGAEVPWNEETQEVTTKLSDKEIKLTIGSKIALVNGEEVELDKEPKLVEGRTLFPLRFISETFGLEVEFENTPYMYFVTVMTPEYSEELKALMED